MSKIKNQEKNKKYPRDDVFLDLFMIWWINCEPEILLIVSNDITWSSKILFLKICLCYHSFCYWKNLPT